MQCAPEFLQVGHKLGFGELDQYICPNGSDGCFMYQFSGMYLKGKLTEMRVPEIYLCIIIFNMRTEEVDDFSMVSDLGGV